MDEAQLRVLADDVRGLNALALERVREAVNDDPVATAARYGLEELVAHRIGRLPYAALAQAASVPFPLLLASLPALESLLPRAAAAAGAPPAVRDSFADGTDPVLARLYLQALRADAWRYAPLASVRWGVPMPLLDALVVLPVAALVLVAEALPLALRIPPQLAELFAELEVDPLGTLPSARVATVAAMLLPPAAPPAVHP